MFNKENEKVVTWEDCKGALEQAINTRNSEYAESFRKARVQEAQFQVKSYIEANPKATREEVEAFAKDYIDQAPDEFARNLRTYCHLGTALFNQLARLNAEFNDFKEVYLAVNEENIKAYAERHKDEIIKQQKQMEEARIQAERKARAETNKKALDKKLGKK